MKKLFLSIFVLSSTCFTALVADSPTLDEIIQKNFEARGGAENWQAVKSMKIAGDFTSFSVPRPYTMYRKRPDFYRIEYFLSTKQVTRTYDGEATWWINPWFETFDAGPIPSPDSLVTLREKEFENILWNYRKKKSQVELLGTGDVDGQACYRLKVTQENGSEETWYINSDTFLEIKMEGHTYTFSEKVELVIYFDDFRETGGIMLPYFVEQEFSTFHRVYEIEKIDINFEIDDSIFKIPAAEKTAEESENY